MTDNVMRFNASVILKPKPHLTNLTAEQWQTKAEALWALLDDIDTAGDMFKPETTPFFKYVIGKAEERHRYIESDGYKLFPV